MGICRQRRAARGLCSCPAQEERRPRAGSPPGQVDRHARKEEARHQREQIRRRVSRRRRTRQGVIAIVVIAVLVTIVGVFVIIALGRIATRIGADPLEFKYPPAKKDE